MHSNNSLKREIFYQKSVLGRNVLCWFAMLLLLIGQTSIDAMPRSERRARSKQKISEGGGPATNHRICNSSSEKKLIRRLIDSLATPKKTANHWKKTGLKIATHSKQTIESRMAKMNKIQLAITKIALIIAFLNPIPWTGTTFVALLAYLWSPDKAEPKDSTEPEESTDQPDE